MARESWREEAACRGLLPALFYPERGEDASSARDVCRTCPVAEECLTDALVEGERWGIWAGTTPSERRVLRPVWRRSDGAGRDLLVRQHVAAMLAERQSSKGA